jgi:hypothetical protein
MKKSFNEVFNSLKTKYETKKRDQREVQAYELLKKMIKIYGYNSVCDKISLNKQNNKNNELGAFINDIKNSFSLELLCSQLFYLDDSVKLNSEKEKALLNNKKTLINGKENNILFKSEKKEEKEEKDSILNKINN